MQQPIELDEDLALRELELKWSFQKGLDSSPLCLLRLRTRLPSRRTSTAALQRHSNGRPGPPPEKHDDKMLKSQGLAQYVIKGPAVFHVDVDVDGDSVLPTGGLGTCTGTLHIISSPRVMVDGLINGRVLSKNSVYYGREAEVSSSKSTDAGTSTEASSST